MKKNSINPMPEYFDRYINKADDEPVLKALENSLTEISNLPVNQYNELGSKVYATGKWTVKDIIQHMIDTERVFGYRAVAFARGEKGQVLSFDEDAYAKKAMAGNRKLEDIIEEWKTLRRSTIDLFRSFSDEMLLSVGKGFKGEYSVLAIGFMIQGHQRWHVEVIEERYLPMLKQK